MKKLLFSLLVPVASLCFICCACSSSSDSEPEKGKIEKLTEQVGQEAAEGIKKPIDKARKVDDLAKQRMKNLEQPGSSENQ